MECLLFLEWELLNCTRHEHPSFLIRMLLFDSCVLFPAAVVEELVVLIENHKEVE